MDESRSEASHGLAGRIVAGGAKTRASLHTLLGVGDAGTPFAVTSAAWMDHAVEVGVYVGDGPPAVIRIERRKPESQGLVITSHLVVYTRGERLPPSLVEAVRRVASRKLASLSLDQLAALFARDPESGKPGMPMPPAVDDSKRPSSLLDTWGAEDSYADFFAGGELARSQLDSIDPTRLFRFAQHCDAECHFVNPRSVAGMVFLVSYPWDNRVREPLRPFDQGMANLADPQFLEEGVVTSDIDEDDVIHGNPAKLEALIAHATSQPNADGRLLFFSNTCVPTVIGEDVESAVKRARDRTGKPILYLTVTPRSMTNVFQSLLVDRRLAAEHVAGAPAGAAVNLVGYPDSGPAPELRALLRAGGVDVNTHLIPDLSQARIDDLAKGRLNVYCPNRLWQNLYDQVMSGSRTPHLMPPAPYGMAATEQWFTQIVRAIRPETDVQAVWTAATGSLRPAYQLLQQEASGHRLGLVVRDAEAHYLLSPEATWGVPVLSALEEMGFGIDVLVHVSEPELAKRTARALRQAFREPSRHSLLAFDSLPLLRQRLRESRARAFLSYHTFDWRLSEAGKGRFSLQHFEMGPQGAVRTLERLLQVCRSPFYTRYGRFLQRDRLGLRSPPSPASEHHG